MNYQKIFDAIHEVTDTPVTQGQMNHVIDAVLMEVIGVSKLEYENTILIKTEELQNQNIIMKQALTDIANWNDDLVGIYDDPGIRARIGLIFPTNKTAT